MSSGPLKPPHSRVWWGLAPELSLESQLDLDLEFCCSSRKLNTTACLRRHVVKVTTQGSPPRSSADAVAVSEKPFRFNFLAS